MPRASKKKDAERQPYFYFDQFTGSERALIAAFAAEAGLDDEVWLQRIINRRLLEAAEADNISTQDLCRVAQALALGTGRVGRLLRDRRAISGAAAESLTEAVAHALTELATELNLQL